MATPEQIKAIAGLYVAYFDRAPDPAGLQFWVDQLDNGRDFATISQDFAISLEAKEIYPFLATPDVSSLGATNLVTSIYQNLFGRTPEAAGLQFWVNVVESGSVAVGDMVEAIMMGAQDTLVNGQLILDKTTVANKIECALEFVTGASNIPGFQFDAEAYSAARGAIDGVDATDESVEAAKFFTANYFGTAGNNRTDVHTLCEPDSIMLTPAEADQFVKQTVIYWGYNPHSHDETDGVDNLDGNDPNGNDNNLTNEGPEDGGVSAAEFFGSGGIFETIVGISLGDLASDGAINPNDDQPLYNFSMLEEINLEAVGDGTGVLHFAFADGTADDIVLTQEYFALVNDLFFDEEGNTRFFEKEIIAQLPVYVDANGNVTTTPQADQEPIGYVDAVLEGADATYEVGGPIILTPTANNGSTYERGFTSEVDDLIQAGRVELLHGAIIDGGLGSNTLEIDGKGYYAQPKKLDNIQHISVHDLPNVYSSGGNSTMGGSNSVDSYPDLADTISNPNTIIDISRATDLETLTVTQGDFAGLGASDSTLGVVGNLTITGIRNGAETTLDGFFEAGTNIRLNYSSLSGDGLDLVFNNLNMRGDLEISHNATKINIESVGGSNFLASGDFADDDDNLEGQVREMVITGDAHLHIDGNMDSTFANATPVIINASGNTGGVDLALTGSENVTFIGSSANDAFDVITAQAADPTGQDADFDNDQSVTIIGGAGNNNYQVGTYTLTASNGDGNNNYEFEAVEANITLGDGDNHIEGNTVNFTAVAGDGDNRFDIEAYDSPQSSVWTYIDDLDTVVDITAGNGANVINVFANPLTLTAGGNLISGGNGHYLKPAQISIVAGDGGNTILIPALPFDLDSSDGVLSTVDVTTGDGNDDIFVGGSDITISSGGGNDTITLLGVDRDFAYDTLMLEDGNDPITATTNSQRADELVEGGALLNIDTGTGSARINLGNNESSAFDPSGQNGVIIAKDGSVITGENITLFVDTYANLIAADVSGVTSVILDDDSFNYTASPQANDNYSGDRAQLTITDEQFLAIGADNMRVDGATFNTHAFVKIVVTESTSLTALGVDDLPRNIDLYLEIQDGVTLTMTAEQLHTRVARDGVTLAQDGNTDLAAGRVIIEGGGINFDPFNTNDTVSTVIAGNVYYGGSLSDDFLAGSGSNQAWYNVQVKSVFGGYDRPADAEVEIAFTIDADVTSEVGAFDTWHDNVEIVGNQDITFTGPIQLGLLQGENNNLFTVDFSTLEGNANGLTLGNFEMVEAVYGNSGIGYDTEVFVEIDGNSQDGNAAQRQAAADAAQAAFDAAETALSDAEDAVDAEQTVVDDAEADVAAAQAALDSLIINGAGNFAIGLAQGALALAEAALAGAKVDLENAQEAAADAEATRDAALQALLDANAALASSTPDAANQGDVGFDNDDPAATEDDDRALISQGVLQYTVTVIEGNGVMTEAQGDTATIRLCDDTEDLETIALRGNWNDTLEILDAAHGLNFELQGGNTLKREGPTHTSNVGKLEASFKWDHAVTTVDIFHSVAGDTRPIDAAGIVINNADTITVNSEGPAVTIGMLMGDSLNSVILNAAGDMTIDLENKFDVDGDNSVDLIDATGVVGVFTAGVDGQFGQTDAEGGDFTFLGGAGGAELTLCDVDDDAAGGVTIDGGTGGVNLTIEGTVDIDESTLINIGTVTLADESTLRISMEDADAIGAGNFLIEDGDMAMLHLVGLSDQEFALANYANGITVELVSIAALPEVTLNPLTDLTGIGMLEVPEGTILNLTALQFQQLTGDGTIVGIDEDGMPTTNYTVNITDWDQASVNFDANGDGDTDDADENFILDGITADNLTITMLEDIALEDADSLGTADVSIGDGMTLTLADIQQADGLEIGGGTGTTLKFTDIVAGAAETIDASGFGVDTLLLPNTLVANRNVDLMFYELPETVTKQIYTGLGFVEGVTQNVVIEEGVTVPGFLVFNRPEADFEIQIFNLTLEGGAHIQGNLRLSASENENDLLQMDLQEVNIVSTGTAENLLNGGTANIIGGVITPLAGPFPNIGGDNAYTSVDNDLLTVNISGDQVLEVGGIVFNSTVGNDGVTANDDDSAIATLNVNSSAAVVIGDLDTDSDNVDFLVVNNDGTGDLTIGISSLATVDAGDVITLNGSATGIDTAIVSGTRDFSGDTIEADWDFIQFNNGDNGTVDVGSTAVDESADNVSITVTQQQFIDIGAAGFLANGDDTATDNDATLNIVAFDGSVPFDATGLDADITIGTITMAPGVQTLDPSTNLTGVGKINVPEGGTLNLTAAQYQQIVGMGGLKICVVDGSDADTDIEAPITVNITGLTQADIDGGAFDLSMILTDAADDAATDPIGNVTVSLAESVELSDDDIVQTSDVPGTGTLSNVEFILADGQDLGIPLFTQADGLEITGTGTTDVFLRFDDTDNDDTTTDVDYLTRLDVSGYSITQLHALNTFVGGYNVEQILQDLASAVTLVIYHDPEQLGVLNPTNRVVVIEPTVTVTGIDPDGTTTTDPKIALSFNDLDDTDEVLTVSITALGGTVLDGSIHLDADGTVVAGSAPLFLQSFTFISEGDGVTENLLTGGTENIITGNISPFPHEDIPGGVAVPNNLLNVNLIANNDLVIEGTIFFNSVDPADMTTTATLMTSGTAPITIKALDATSSDQTIETFAIDHTGTAPLTITGGSDSLELDGVESLIVTGTGDIVLDTNMTVGNNGIDSETLSLLDASGLSGNFTVGVIEDVDSDNFAFVSGSGVTTATMAMDTLNDALLTDMNPLNDGTGWSFDFTNAAVGSKLTLGPGLTINDGAVLDIDMGPNGVLCINQSLDLSDVNFTFSGTQSIVLADGVTLTLSAAQADGLNIIAGADTGAPGFTGEVNVVDLGEDPVDLSGIAEEIAGHVSLDLDQDDDGSEDADADQDVTLDIATDLGFFAVALQANSPANLDPAPGQTIRFTTVEQAQRVIDVFEDAEAQVPWDAPGADDGNNINSTNVVWLFPTIPAQLDTTGYDANVGRLWVSAELVNSVGGDIEDLFNSLPNTIIRVDFNTVTELDVLLSSVSIERRIELTSFTDIVGITEVDDDILPQEEHIAQLRIDMGGEVMVGNIIIGDVVAAPDTDPTTPEFDFLRLVSKVALDDRHYLATEDHVNNNNGTNEPGETAQPMAVNTVGDILVGGTNPGIELDDVRIDTFFDVDANGLIGDDDFDNTALVGGSGDNQDDGADFVFGTLVFEKNTAGNAEIDIDGENDVTGKAIDASDAEVTSVTIDTAGHSGTFLLTGGSPAFVGGDDSGDNNTEILEFDDNSSGDGQVLLGHVFSNLDGILGNEDDFVLNGDGVNFYAGIDGSTLSLIDTTDHGGTVNLGVIADVDSELFAVNNDGSAGDVIMCFGTALSAGGVLETPELSATGFWDFSNEDGATGSMTVELKNVVLNAGGSVEFDDVDLVISGDIDLSVLDVPGAFVSFSGGSISVVEGGCLTLSVGQAVALEAAGYTITGSGTVKVVGNADDVGDFGALLGTVNVNLAGIVLTDEDETAAAGDEVFGMTVIGATDDAGDPADQNVIGTPFDDDFNVTAPAGITVTVTAGADTGATDTINSDEDGATIVYDVDLDRDVTTSLEDGDIIQVAAGAEFDGTLLEGEDFTATAETSNDGTAIIRANAGDFPDNNTTIDMSLASGTAGFTIVGNDEINMNPNRRADTLIGSENDDTFIDGVPSSGNNQNKEDTFTGSGGADTYVFNFADSDPLELTTSPSDPDAEDYDSLEFTAVANPGGGYTVQYRSGDDIASFTISGAATATTGSIAIAVAAALNALPNVDAVVDGGNANLVNITSLNGVGFDFLGTVESGGLVVTETFSTAPAFDTDVAEVQVVTIQTGTAAAGEVYTLEVQLGNGTNIIGTFTAAGSESQDVIRDALILDFNNNAEAALPGPGNEPVLASNTGPGEITLTDQNADDGGFMIVTNAGTPVIEASSASSVLDGSETDLEAADSDVITDFIVSGADQDFIDFGLAAGTASNFEDEAFETSYADARDAAEAAMLLDPDLIYVFTGYNDDGVGNADGITGDVGLLFVDANGNNAPDTVLTLVGVAEGTFDSDSILGS